MPVAAHTGHTEQLDLEDADVRYTPGFVQADAADALLQQLLDGTDWQQPDVRLFGRTYRQPRLTAWYGDAGTRYRYSGLELHARGWTPALFALRTRIEQHCGRRFNSVLLNCYRDGRDAIALHSDDEPELGPRPVIAALSLGAERPLVFRHRTRRDLATRRILLGHGSLLDMRGDTQAHWRHGIERTRARSAGTNPCGPRVSLTFRFVHPSFAPRSRTSPEQAPP
jgi:alkylated DNA repair dioxygenase AlkB